MCLISDGVIDFFFSLIETNKIQITIQVMKCFEAIRKPSKGIMVPGAGLEPARSYDRGILNPLCLPISPPGLRGLVRLHYWVYFQKMEAGPGVEPRSTDLQSAA